MSQINVNNIRAKDGVGAVGFPGGINATGVVTATTFKGALEGNVTGTADLASNLTGTPNITVGTVTGTDATFSGNLTVNGTTTTIDTAVTAVDSLAVDGSVGIGTTSAESALHVVGSIPNAPTKFGVHVGAHSGYGVMQFTSDTGGIIDFGESGVDSAGRIIYTHSDDTLKVQTNNVERLRIDGNGTTKFKGPLTEKFHNDSNALTGDYNHDLITHGNVYWSVSNSSGPFTFNLRGSASVSLDSMMSDGESLSFLLTHATNNASNYMTAFKVDGNTLINGTHIWWPGGTAPSAAGTSGYDVYSFTLYKIGGASFRAFASLTNHA